LDECITNPKLIEKVREEGYDVIYLGRGLPDWKIFEFVIEKKGILVTEDREFHEWTRMNDLDPCFISKDEKNLMISVGLIKKHMKKFESVKT